ncbi:MAG TPA: hypothetical protein VFU14_12920, partial [Acidimicrobiales bacterium]|nr:hypothetical protein [Acidimicrobiales bacterium]
MGAASSPRLLALHALRLRGVAEAEEIAEYTGADLEAIRAELARLESDDLVRYRRGRIGGYAHTPEGRALGERLLAEELDEHGLRPRIEAAYEEFLTFNRQLLTVCTSWQLRTVDGQ